MVEAVMADLQSQGVVYGALAGVGTAQTDGQFVGGKELASWLELYSGGTLQVKLSGPPFMTVAGGVGQSLPCVADETWTTGVSEP
jgi:hypothetical protein